MCRYFVYGVVEVQVILKNELDLFAEFSHGQVDDVLGMPTIKSKRGSGNDWITVVLGVSRGWSSS
jgi:hypothetical protein